MTEQFQTLDETLAQADELVSDREEHFVQLARRLSVGEKPSAEVISQVLHRAGKQGWQLSDLVSCLQLRASLRQREANADSMRKRLEEIAVLAREADIELERARQRHFEIAGPLRDESAQIKYDLAQLAGIPSQLMASCPSEKLKREYRSTETQQVQLRAEIQGLEREVGRVRAEARMSPASQAAMHAKRIDRATESLRQAQRQSSDLVRRREELSDAMIDF